jgi:Domain of unknown function (DUF4190)
MSYPPPGGTPDPYGQGGAHDPYGQQQPDPYGQQQQPDPYGASYGGGYKDPYAAPGSPASGAPYTGQPYQQPYPAYGTPQAGTNVMAILSLVFAFVFAPVGIVLGHVAKKQIKQTGEQGDGLATAGLVISYIFTGLTVLVCCGWLILVIGLGASGSGTNY